MSLTKPFSIISSLRSFQEQWTSLQSGFNQETTQSIHIRGNCIQGLGSLVMDEPVEGISHHGGATIPLGWGALAGGDVMGAYAVGAGSLEETKVLWSYLVRQRGRVEQCLQNFKEKWLSI